MSEFLLALFFYRPKAFLLLSYLKHLSCEKENTTFTFPIEEIRAISARPVLTKEQVKRNLKLLSERKFISVRNCQYTRKVRIITLLCEREDV